MDLQFLPQDVLQFWFHELTPKDWWKKDSRLDARITKRFGDLHTAAVQGTLSDWRETAEGRLAEIIVLDQFSRNIFRDRPEAFAQDELALTLAREAVASGAHEELEPPRLTFLLMPYMHSEDAETHQQAVELFNAPGLDYNLEFEYKHKAIIDRFGRYPHRNAILGRESTPEELEFLKGPGSSF